MKKRFGLLCLTLMTLGTGCKVYESKGPEPNAGKDLTPICHAGSKSMRVPDEAVRAHLGHGDSLGECG